MTGVFFDHDGVGSPVLRFANSFRMSSFSFTSVLLQYGYDAVLSYYSLLSMEGVPHRNTETFVESQSGMASVARGSLFFASCCCDDDYLGSFSYHFVFFSFCCRTAPIVLTASTPG